LPTFWRHSKVHCKLVREMQKGAEPRNMCSAILLAILPVKK
jgi:hypothetical protein